MKGGYSVPVKKKIPPPAVKKRKYKESDNGHRPSRVGLGEIKSVMAESVWRTMHEIFPTLGYGKEDRLNSDEFIAHNLLLALVCGDNFGTHRQPLVPKISRMRYGR